MTEARIATNAPLRFAVAALVAITLLAAVPAQAAPRGSLDRSFGGGRGYVMTNFHTGRYDLAYLHSVRGTSTGRPMAVGSSGSVWSHQYLAAARYLDDGTLDRRFGKRGRKIIATGNGTWEFGSIATGAGPAGSTVVAGLFHHNLGDVDLAPVDVQSELISTRLRADGSIDRAYGTKGRTVVPISPSLLIGYYTTEIGAHVGRDGSVTFAAWSVLLAPCGFGVPCAPHPSFLTLVRLTRSGSLDPTFGARGIAVVPTPEAWYWSDLVVRGDGRLDVIGSEGNDILIRRFLPNGIPDAAFGVAGIAVVDAGTISHSPFTSALAPNGDIVIAAIWSNDLDPLGPWRTVLVRVHPDGSIDKHFGRNGAAVIHTQTVNGINQLIVTRTRIYAAVEDYRDKPHAYVLCLDAAARSTLWRSPDLPMEPFGLTLALAGRHLLVGGTATPYQKYEMDFATYRLNV
jgi:uncharacterized delta-60 repeat protein